jgi:hypothetical protein
MAWQPVTPKTVDGSHIRAEKGAPNRSVAGRPGRPHRRPEALLGDKGYDSNPNREELYKRRILPVISRKGAPTSRAWERLAIRWERRTELHDAFVSLACSLICWRRLKRARS